MYIDAQYDNLKSNAPYVETVTSNVSNDATFSSSNELFEKLSITINFLTEKERIFNLFKNCMHFGEIENKHLNDYLKSISVEEKNNIFDYYD